MPIILPHPRDPCSRKGSETENFSRRSMMKKIEDEEDQKMKMMGKL